MLHYRNHFFLQTTKNAKNPITFSAGADEIPPPKPSRQPQNAVDQTQAAPVSTYIVAQSPEVLAQLLKDNHARGVCPSVYTTPATPFNSLAVQFQDEDQVLTTAAVSDLPFFDPAISEPSASHENHSQSADSTLSETNLDSLDSSDTMSPLMSSLTISDSTHCQNHSPAATRSQRVKEMQNLYAVSSKVLGTTGDLYSPVQKFAPVSSTLCGEIYGPVANFTQSSAIVGNLSQSPSVGGNFGENPGNPSTHGNYGNNQIISSISSQSQTSSVMSQSFTGQVSSQNAVPTASYLQSVSPNITIPSAGAECLYGPVLKFRAQNSQNQGEVKSATPPNVSHIQNARVYSPTPMQGYQAQLYPQNYQHQQIYSNLPGQEQMYISRAQPVQRQNSQNSYQQNSYQSQASYPQQGPIYTVHATPTSIVQAQKMQGFQVQGGASNSQMLGQQSQFCVQNVPAQQVAVLQQQAVPVGRQNLPQMATGVAKVTTFVAQKPDELLTTSTDGTTLSGSLSLVSSAVSDSTSTSSMNEEAQQDQVCKCLLGMTKSIYFYFPNIIQFLFSVPIPLMSTPFPNVHMSGCS